MPFRPFLRAAAIAAGAAQSLAAAAEPAPAFIGHSIGQATDSEFVHFFHLEKVLQQPDGAHPGMVLTLYGTTGQFKGYVNLLFVTAQGSDTVSRTALMVRRDFIDNARTAVFARDIVKSFIERTNAAGVPEVQALHAHLWECLQPHAASCDDTAPAWLTYAGKQEKDRIDFPGGYVMLQNSPVMQVPMLVVENGP